MQLENIMLSEINETNKLQYLLQFLLYEKLKSMNKEQSERQKTGDRDTFEIFEKEKEQQ